MANSSCVRAPSPSTSASSQTLPSVSTSRPDCISICRIYSQSRSGNEQSEALTTIPDICTMRTGQRNRYTYMCDSIKLLKGSARGGDLPTSQLGHLLGSFTRQYAILGLCCKKQNMYVPVSVSEFSCSWNMCSEHQTRDRECAYQLSRMLNYTLLVPHP